MSWRFLALKKSLNQVSVLRKWWHSFFLGSIATLLFAGCQTGELLAPLEEITYQALFWLRGTQDWDSRLVLIAVEETQILQPADARQQYAKLLDIIAPAQPSLAVLNLLMSQSTSQDQKLAEAMAGNIPVVLGMAWDQQGIALMPTSQLQQEATGVGHIFYQEDQDLITRQIDLEIDGIPALGLIAAQIYNQNRENRKLLIEKDFLWVNYPRNVADLTVYEIKDVLAGKVPHSALANKIVLIGTTFSGLEILHTPFNHHQSANGIHLQATVISNLLQNNYLRSLGWRSSKLGWEILLYLLLASTFSFAVATWRLRWVLVVQLLICFGWFGLTLLAFSANYLLPVASPIVLLSLCSLALAVQKYWRMAAQININQQQLWKQAYYASLTGLPKRDLFMQFVSKAMVNSQEQPVVVMFLDLDRFRAINESFSYTVGDQLISAIANQLKICLRLFTLSAKPEHLVTKAILAHFGGDKFALLIQSVATQEVAIAIAKQISQQFSSPFKIAGKEVFCTLSIGIASSAQLTSKAFSHYDLAEQLLCNAEFAMYQAKVTGKARHVLFNKQLADNSLTLLQLETDLRQAIEAPKNNFSLRYQPIIDLKNYQIIGFESLIRWQHPTQGWLSPLKFIPVAEDTGLIHPLGFWVLREACRQMLDWQTKFPHLSQLTVAVNLSPTQLQDIGIVAQIESILLQTGLASHHLKLEVTETDLMANLTSTTHILKKIQALGVQLSIDDFGTGYSSLGRLQNLPFNTLKIDRSFVMEINHSKSLKIIQTIITLAHNLGMDVVAEGVETKEQLLKLKELDCDYVQGHYFSKALDATKATTILINRS